VGFKDVAYMHDIGKISISENILNKPEKLTLAEWDEIKHHPAIGYRILKGVEGYSFHARVILYHHERWDGTGYPMGAKGDRIPILSRILAIADAYEAMTADRPYRGKMSDEEAVEELKNNSGIQFDPELVEIFIEKVLRGK
jgi:HD-GYP domain-containing protein (c-di-GMP phosphodiesterase class II)